MSLVAVASWFSRLCIFMYSSTRSCSSASFCACSLCTFCCDSMSVDLPCCSREAAPSLLSTSRRSFTSSSLTRCTSLACECSSNLPTSAASVATLIAIVCSAKQRTVWMPASCSSSTSVGVITLASSPMPSRPDCPAPQL